MRMLYRNIRKDELVTLIRTGEVIENYPDDFPYPSKLIFKIVEDRPLHAVIALNEAESQGIVVTLYEPDSEHFEPDYKTRKKKIS